MPVSSSFSSDRDAFAVPHRCAESPRLMASVKGSQDPRAARACLVLLRHRRYSAPFATPCHYGKPFKRLQMRFVLHYRGPLCSAGDAERWLLLATLAIVSGSAFGSSQHVVPMTGHD